MNELNANDKSSTIRSDCLIMLLNDNDLLNICSKLNVTEIGILAQVNKRFSLLTSHNFLWGVRFLKAFLNRLILIRYYFILF